MKNFYSILLLLVLSAAGFAASAVNLAYITTNSTGNVWAYDGGGNYFDAWPGKPISELPKATYMGKLYYVMAYTHNNADSPKLIFNDGTNQTEEISVVANDIFEYTGGTTYTKLEPPHYYTVAGSPAELFVNEWAPTYSRNDMSLVDGLYTWTKEGVQLPACNIEFRICQDHAWTVAYPENNYVYYLAEAGTYDVTITFNSTTKAIECIVTPAPPAPYAKVYIDKTSAEGNIYAFDSQDYYIAWPGVPISSLETAQVSGTDYYVWGFNHEGANGPYVIFSDGDGQTADIAVADGDILKYLGSKKYILNGVEYPLVVPGDANGDSRVDVNDVTTVINYILGKNPNPFDVVAANVNGDDKVDVMDVTLIINIILGTPGDE